MLKKFMILADIPGKQLQELADRLLPDGIVTELLRGEALPAALREEDLTETIFLIGKKKDSALISAAGGYAILFLQEGSRGESFPEIRYALEGLEEVDGSYLTLIYRRFRRLPWTVCETQRCLVREFAEEDLDALEAIFSEAEAGAYLDLPEERETRETALSSIRMYTDRIYGFYGYGIWLILDRITQEPLGCAGFSVRPGAAVPELGFTIKSSWRRRGYACEVCRAILELARSELGFEQVGASVRRDNAASAGLLRKLGFRGPVKAAAGFEESGADRYIRSLL